MFCARLKEFLRKNAIAFVDRDITSDETALGRTGKAWKSADSLREADRRADAFFAAPSAKKRRMLPISTATLRTFRLLETSR
jgi:hypothetical protein